MEFNFYEIDGVKLVEILNKPGEIKLPQDGLDVVGNSIYGGSYKIIIHESGLASEFFELRTGLAGEILQKFSNYNCELAIVGDFSKYPSKALEDFIRESNRQGRINFVDSIEQAQTILLKNRD
ncbi:DUF4180 domain-containing protein [Candidatus Peregrinibacteria bacterium]|nr:DUF4180 domain-containing protein [Candidatus Peregrinibacteria bacterium]